MYKKSLFKRILILKLIFILFLLFFSLAQAQRDLGFELKKAEGFLNAGKFSEAIDILKSLYSEHPENQETISLLKRAYYETKSYADLVVMLEELVQGEPYDWRLWAELGEVELRLKQHEKAEQSFSKAIELGSNQAEAYQRVALNYRVHGFTQKAIQTYKLANKNLNANIFSMELISLYQATRDYKSSVEEYFTFMGKDPKKFETVEKGVRDLINSGEDLEGIEFALQGIIQKDSTNKYAYKLYGDLFLAKGELEKAFAVYKIIDHLWEGKGGYILNFAQGCLRRELFKLALEACEYLISDYQNPQLLNRVRLCKANSLTGLKRFEDAVKVFNEIIGDERKTNETILACYNIGEIKYKELNKAEDAFPWYQRVLAFPGSSVYPDALVRLGDCWMSMGELDSAFFWFTEILANPKAQEKKEEIRFKLAEIDFYKGEFKSAQEKYKKIVIDFPKGFYVNNSLERISILGENMEANPLALLVFSQAIFEEVKGESEKSISLFEKLIGSQDPFLSDDSKLQIGYVLRKKGEFKNSILRLEELIKDYPQSPFCALAQKVIGDIYYYNLKDLENAEKAYLSVLKNFSSSLFVEEARVNLKKISQQKVEG
jgi:tetratricopeptide (TPR) repeat protein